MVAAAIKMRDQNVDVLNVLDNDKLVGVVTGGDIVVKYMALGMPEGCVVGDIMSTKVITCYEYQSIVEAAGMMGDHQIRQMPVYNQAERLVGMLFLDKIAENYSEHLAGETLGEIVESREPPHKVLKPREPHHKILNRPK